MCQYVATGLAPGWRWACAKKLRRGPTPCTACGLGRADFAGVSRLVTRNRSLMFKTIVVGLDGSERQPGVVRQAVELADRMGGRLVLCRAMQIPLSIPAVAWSLAGDDFENFLVGHGREALKRVEEEIPEALRGGIESGMGQPGDFICKVAEERRADLIVIGSHGYDRVDRLLGTTAAKVVNRARCTVLVVRNPDV